MNPIIVPVEDLILASGSESRKTILNEAGLKFSVQPSSVDESIIKELMVGKPFSDQVIALACAKAKDISQKFPNSVVIGGDQMCVHHDQLFSKPGTKEQAIINLKKLSGTSHYQHSGICLFKNGQSLWEYSEYAEMVMHDLTDSEIENYVDIENPINAAGAYKFESLGCNLFKSVKGSSYTVRGMPLLPLLNKLRELDIISLNK
jgi:septum formation protein